jgi:mono/diheme cytochrome c family protein
MRRVLLIAGLLLVVGACAAPESEQPTVSAEQQKQDLVARGQYLVTIGACDDCHSPKIDPATATVDMERRLSGRPQTTPPPAEPTRPGEISVSADLTAWWGPWGVSYAANLTPDPETGLGKRYDEAKFIDAIRTGKKPEGEPLLPPMPWPAYRHFTDDDLKAIWAYLQTLQPVSNFVRSAAPAN